VVFEKNVLQVGFAAGLLKEFANLEELLGLFFDRFLKSVFSGGVNFVFWLRFEFLRLRFIDFYGSGRLKFIKLQFFVFL
jgi:hypothetical protein